MPGSPQHQDPLTFQLSSSPLLKCLPDSPIHLLSGRSFTKATQLPREEKERIHPKRSRYLKWEC